MKVITVDLSARSYPIYLGTELFANQDVWTSHIRGQQVMIVTQKNIAAWYLDTLRDALQGYQVDVTYLLDGEQYKTLAEWQKIIDALVQANHERSTTLVALGGGIVGDMTGFAAACYLRGVTYIQIPTTLIAQVDSAVGGKTGVNHALGKNLIGAFYQPSCVVIDINTLKTLPAREFVAGLAEVIKYGLIYDVAFFEYIERYLQEILNKDAGHLQYIIERSVAIKAEIVALDERDMGLRNILNFGHTFGHALETACGYQGILHGEAVAIGMLMAAQLSADKDMLATCDVQRISALLTRCGLLVNIPEVADIFQIMKKDKKVQEGQINLILLSRIGKAEKMVHETA